MIKPFFNSKTVIKKIIIAIIFIFIFNFTFGSLGSNIVLADDELEELPDGGGKLLLPLHSFVLFVTDSVLELIQNNFISPLPITIDAESSTYSSFELPYIQYTPEAIFSNNIALFNINFFNPIGSDKLKITSIKTELKSYTLEGGTFKNLSQQKLDKFTQNNYYTFGDISEFRKNISDLNNPNSMISIMKSNLESLEEIDISEIEGENVARFVTGIEMNSISFKKDYGSYIFGCNSYDNAEDIVPEVNAIIELYNTAIENIGDLALELLDETTLQKFDEEYGDKFIVLAKEEYEVKTEVSDTGTTLQLTVSTIYKSLRILAIVSMLTILVYVGIRIVLSSAAKDKAKYKQMLIDWLIAFVMLFVLHYLMAFIIEITEKITDICDASNVSNLDLEVPSDTTIDDEVISTSEINNILLKSTSEAIWKTNFIGKIRYYAGLVQEKGYSFKGISYTVMYIVLVIQICIFTFQYLKRVLWMAFLTMIAPLVSITYPLDKINDGKAQGFNLWLKEYIFNALLQSIHYIIYVIIIGSAMELVAENPIYGLVALGFMVPAEKFIRKMFGFENATTVGAFSGAAGAALLMGGIQKLSAIGRMGKKNEKKDNDSKNKKPNTKIRKIEPIPEHKSRMDELREKHGDKYKEYKEKKAKETGYNTDVRTDDQDKNHKEFEKQASSEKSSSESNEKKNQADASTPISKSDSTPSSKPKSKNSVKNGFKTMRGLYRRRIVKGLKKLPGAGIRLVRRGATYGLGAATLGGVGLAAGIASGDPSKTLQYTMAAGTVGGNIGRNLGDSASSILGLGDAAKAFKAGYYGESSGEKERKKANREFKGDESNYVKAVGNVGVDGWEEMSQKGGIIDQALDYGINDIGEMCNIYQLTKPPYNKTTTEAFRAYELNKKFGDIGHNSKTNENLDKILDSKGYSKANKDKMKKEILSLIESYKKLSLD